MSYKQRLEKFGATPGKLALIGVLSLVLLGVVVKQLPKGQFPQGAAENLTPTPTTPAQQQAQAGKETPPSSQEKKDLPPWPEANLTEASDNDPFALPAWAVVEEEPATIATNEDPDDLAELQEQGASIVVIGGGQKSARIGEQRLYVGDILEGYRVTDITIQGILLRKLNQR